MELKRQPKQTASNSETRPRVRRIGSLVGQLMTRRGYAQAAVCDDMQGWIADAVGKELESSVQVGKLRGGVLHVYAADSVTLQELDFRKRAILKHLQRQTTDQTVTDLRFRIQS